MLYWNHNGKYQKRYEKLCSLIDEAQGEIDNSMLLSNLNRFIYDLYNNGLCNLDNYTEEYWDLVNNLKSHKLPTKAKEFCSNLEKLLNEHDHTEHLCDEGWEEVDCFNCNGEGVIECEDEEEDEQCSECEGHGFVTEEKISEKEQHILFVVEPLIEKCSKNDSGCDELMDYIIELLICDPKVNAISQ